MEDRGTVSPLYPIYYLLSSAAEAALADGLGKLGMGPPLRQVLKGRRFEGQARFFSSPGKSEVSSVLL